MAQTRAEKRQSVDLPSEGRMFGRKMWVDIWTGMMSNIMGNQSYGEQKQCAEN